MCSCKVIRQSTTELGVRVPLTCHGPSHVHSPLTSRQQAAGNLCAFAMQHRHTANMDHTSGKRPNPSFSSKTSPG